MTDFPTLPKAALAEFREASADIIAETVERSLQRTGEVAGHGSDARRIVTVGMEFTVRDARCGAGNR